MPYLLNDAQYTQQITQPQAGVQHILKKCQFRQSCKVSVHDAA